MSRGKERRDRGEWFNPLTQSTIEPAPSDALEEGPKRPEAAPQVPTQPAVELPAGPPVRRRKHRLKFGDIYETRSFSIDKRLLEALDDYMDSGETRTAQANRLFLKVLIEAGYNLDPDLLKQPPIKS